jgi:hypothetical protein
MKSASNEILDYPCRFESPRSLGSEGYKIL